MPELSSKRQTSAKGIGKEKGNKSKPQSAATNKEGELLLKEPGRENETSSASLETSHSQGDKISVSVEVTEEETPVPKIAEVKLRDVMREEPILTNLVAVKYTGDKDEREFFHGQGSAEFCDGNTYSGSFHCGKMHGQGKYTWVDGIIYKGSFINNVITGNGKYKWPNNSIYEGEVVNGKRHGKGLYVCGKTGSCYEGDWVTGKRHGQGTLYYNGGRTTYYCGDWVDNRKCGTGTMVYRSGNKYEGHWLADLRHGKGSMKWYNLSEEYRGEWKEGKMTGIGTYTWYINRASNSQYPLRNEYHGQFKDGVREGNGTFHYASGASYSGVWHQNKKHGPGKFTFKNGLVFEGNFDNDRIVGHPDTVLSGLTTPDIENSGLSVRSQTPVSVETPTGTTDVLDINLTPLFQEHRIDIALQAQETEAVSRILLQHITILRSTYRFYSTLGHSLSHDNTYILTLYQFWRLLKDTGVQRLGFSLALIDRIIAFSKESQASPHYPYRKVFFHDYINSIISVSFLVCGGKETRVSDVFSSALSRFLENHFLPNATHVGGVLFADPSYGCAFTPYLELCHNVYLYIKRMKSLKTLKTDQCLTFRDLLLMMKDLKLINKHLDVSQIISILLAELAMDEQEKLEFNMNFEIVFLDFVEALIGIAQVFIIDDVCEYYLKVVDEGGLPTGEQILLSRQPGLISTAETNLEDVPDSAERSSEGENTESLSPLQHERESTEVTASAKETQDKLIKSDKGEQLEGSEKAVKSSTPKDRPKEGSKGGEGRSKSKKEDKALLPDKKEKGDVKQRKKSNELLKRDKSKESHLTLTPEAKTKSTKEHSVVYERMTPPIIVTCSPEELNEALPEPQEDIRTPETGEVTDATTAVATFNRPESSARTPNQFVSMQDSGLPILKIQSMTSVQLFSLKIKIFLEVFFQPAFNHKRRVDELLETQKREALK